MRIILLRHAKAVGHDEAPSDKERALTGRGQREAAAAGAAIKAAGLTPDVAIVSPARRTRETWAAAAAMFSDPVQTLTEDAVYEADPQRLWTLLHAAEGQTRIVVGHNPGLLELGGYLVDRAGDGSAAARALRAELPTASWTAFSCEPAHFDYVMPALLAYWQPPRD